MTKRTIEPRRMPRPKGTTLAMRRIDHLPKNKKKTQLTKLKTYLLTQYVLNGMCMNGESMDLESMAFWLSIPYKQCIGLLGKVTTDIGQPLDHNGLQDTYRALTSIVIKGALGDRGRAEAQYSAMYDAQRDKEGIVRYKPFISSTANQALKNLFDSNRITLDLMARLVPNPSLIINNNVQNNQQYIGTEEAMNLIYREQQALPEGTAQIDPETLFEEHNLADTPEVKALGPVATDGKLSKQVPDKTKVHSTRRLDTEDVVDLNE